MEDEVFITVPEAAEQLSVRVTAVYNAIAAGRLPFVLKYGHKLISRADLDTYKLRTRPGGEKPKGRPPGAKNKPKEIKAGNGTDE